MWKCTGWVSRLRYGSAKAQQTLNITCFELYFCQFWLQRGELAGGGSPQYFRRIPGVVWQSASWLSSYGVTHFGDCPRCSLQPFDAKVKILASIWFFTAVQFVRTIVTIGVC